MTRDILVYTLACGCTDWCTCAQCGLTEPHTPGYPWDCQQHGKTAVKQYMEVPETSLPIKDGDVAVSGSGEVFTLANGHPMRPARCAVCSLPVDGNPVTVISLIALGGKSCDCGQVASTAYLVHGSHLTMPIDQITDCLSTAMTCQETHPWDK